jgi:hypothetical protein
MKMTAFLKTVKELKRRFGTLATAWKDKRKSPQTEAEQELADFEDLI